MRRAPIALSVWLAACAPDVPSGVFKCASDDECPAHMECLYDPGQSVERHCFDYGVVLGSGADAGQADGGMLAADAAMASTRDASTDAGSASPPSDASTGDTGPDDASVLTDAASYDAKLDCTSPHHDIGVNLFFGTCSLPSGQPGRVVCDSVRRVATSSCVDWCGGWDAEAGCVN